MGTFVLAGATFYEAIRRKILWAALLVGGVFILLFGIGTHFIARDVAAHTRGVRIIQVEVLNTLLLMGLYAVDLLTVMMAVLTSVDTVAGEIASGTIQAVATKPIRRWEIIIGKWLGFGALLTLYLGFMVTGVLADTYLAGHYFPSHLIRGIGLIWGEAILLLSVTFLGGTYLSTLTNGVLSLGLYGLGFLGGWIEQFGAIAQRPSAIRIGILASVIFPSEALWRRAAFEMQSPLVSATGISPFSSLSVPSFAMVVYAGIYLMVVLAAAVRRFSLRDL